VDSLANVVVRDVRDRDGVELGRVVEPHEGTEAGIVAAAERASERMWVEYSDASNVGSRIRATDASGRVRWASLQISFTSPKSVRTKPPISGALQSQEPGIDSVIRSHRVLDVGHHSSQIAHQRIAVYVCECQCVRRDYVRVEFCDETTGFGEWM
jgi:hypothetical protein